MAIVFLPVVKPTAADGTELKNGKLGPCDLVPVFMSGHGMASAHKFTARAIVAMQIICKAETSYDLTCTSIYDVYRPAEVQRNAFYARYRKYYNPLTCVTTSKRVGEDGKYWYKLRSAAPCASIGRLGQVGFFPSSNHGLGIAWDVGVWKYDAVKAKWRTHYIESVPKVWSWVQNNAESFGFSWEGARPGQPGWEPWHLRHVVGNDVTQKVKDCENFFASKA